MTSEKLMSRKDALEAIVTKWKFERTTETVAIRDALGRVAAADAFALYDLPVVRAASMDGIAVNSAMFAAGTPDTSNWRVGAEYVRADTGDDFPDEYDAVIVIEDVTLLSNGGVEFSESVHVTPGMNIAAQGSSVRKGERVASAHDVLRPFDLAALSMGGHTTVEVLRKPVIAYIPTGTELIQPGTVPERGQNIMSNGVLAFHSLTEMGAEPLIFPIVHDDRDALRAAILDAVAKSDVVLVGGGTSKGSEDFCSPLITELGEPLFCGIAVAPGKPMCASFIGSKPVINVPGPPAALQSLLYWCVTALVARFLGTKMPLRKTVTVKLAAPLEATPGMEMLHKFELRHTSDGSCEAVPLKRRSCVMLDAFTAPAQLMTDGSERAYAAGEIVKLEFLR